MRSSENNLSIQSEPDEKRQLAKGKPMLTKAMLSLDESKLDVRKLTEAV